MSSLHNYGWNVGPNLRSDRAMWRGSLILFSMCCLQGVNHTTALSRAIYFILVGTLALIINAALENLMFDPLCVYGFDINSRNVLSFVRDGLLSELKDLLVVFHNSNGI